MRLLKISLFIATASLQGGVLVESKLRGLVSKSELPITQYTTNGLKEKRTLQVVGPDGLTGLQECEGSCTKNSQCVGSLICTQRRAYDPVPGCYGGEQFGADVNFCVPATATVAQPAPAQRNFGGNGMGLCDKDCDKDSDCASGLYCFQRSRGDPIPDECPGLDRSGQEDVCIPKSGGGAPDPVTVSVNPPPITITATSTYSNRNSEYLDECEGDCDSDADCSSGLVCYQRDPGDSVPGCTGIDMDGHTDYCVKQGSVQAPSPTPPPIPQYDFSGPGLQLCDNKDCDDDSDCAGDLICFQREKGDPIPDQCSGSTNSQRDYCVPPRDFRTAPFDVAKEPSRSYTRPFRLRLYWEQGYFWQETKKEWFYCMQRDYDGSSQTNGRCWYGLDALSCDPNHLYIEKCNNDNRQEFVFDLLDNDEALIKVNGQNRCLERDGLEINLRTCDSSNKYQRFFAIRGGFDEYRFEISQRSAVRYCLNQAHHPKPGEVVQMYPCSRVRSPEHMTSFWELY